MGKFKVHFKLMQQQTDEIAQVHKLIVSHAEALEGINGKIENDAALQGIKSNLKNGAAQLQDFAQGMSAMASMISMCLEAYKNTENENVSRVDNTRAHKRDFYKRPVSVPSPGGVDGAGAAQAAAGPTMINIENTHVSQTNTYVATQLHPSSPLPGVSQTVSTAAVPSPATTAGTKQSAGGINGVAAGIAGGAGGLAGGAVVAAAGIAGGAIAKKKKAAKQEEVNASEATEEEFVLSEV